MKKTLVILLIVAAFAACKQKKDVNNTSDSAREAVAPTTSNTNTVVNTPVYSDPDSVGEQTKPDPNGEMISGKVSHQYIKGGCTSVLLVVNGTETNVLIPKDKLPADLDVDGQAVLFSYKSLRMPNLQGCTTGRMIEVIKISKK